MCMSARVYISVPHVYSAEGDQKRVLDPLEVEL